MPEMSAVVEFEVICSRCGAGLCGSSEVRVSRHRGINQVVVDPCEKCLAAEYTKAEEAAALEFESWKCRAFPTT